MYTIDRTVRIFNMTQRYFSVALGVLICNILKRFVHSNVSVTARRHTFDAQTYDAENAHHQTIVMLLSRRSEAWHWSREERNDAENRRSMRA